MARPASSPTTSPLIHSFAVGEVSTDALARVDQERLRLAAQVQENILPSVIGKGQMRPGTGYLGASKSNAQARGIAFARSVSLTYGLELTNALLRIWTPDSLLTRASVTSSVTNGDFSSSTGWTLTATGGGLADINSTVSGALVLSQVNRGGTALCKRSVSTSSGGTEHALRIVVTRGPVFFRCGSADGLDDYIGSTNLDEGIHSLALTPSGTYYVEFQAVSDRQAIVDSITVEAAGVVEFTAPWATAELFQIQHAQSVDIMWLAHTNWQPRKLERRGATSWSLVKYYPDDGPFALPASGDKQITLTPGAAYGNTTLTASGAAFRSTDVGSLVKINCSGFDSTFALAADGAFTEPVRVKGIGAGKLVTITTTGTWSGSINQLVSLDGPHGAYTDPNTVSAISSNTTGTFDPTAAFDNLVFWVKSGFKTGNYTSGVVLVKVSNGTLTTVGQPSTPAAGVAGIFRVTGYTSPTSVDVEVVSPPSSLKPTTDWVRGEWSDRRGWPRAVCFHDGRINFGRDDRVWCSVSDNFYSFAAEQPDSAGNLAVTDASAILKNIATSDQALSVNWMLSLQRLCIGSDGAEISARSDAFDSPITPTSSQFKNFETIGSSQVSPAKFGKQAFYVSSAGDKLYKIALAFEQQDYDADDMMELNEDIGNGGLAGSFAYAIVDMAVQRKPQPYIWCVRSDGTVLVLLFSVKHGISCWTRQLFNGASGIVESVYVLPTSGGQDRVYFWVKRTINGSTVRYLEKLCLRTEAVGATTTKLLDAGQFFAGAASTVTVAHLANATVYAWGNGVQLGPFTADGSGNVALGVSATNIWVGLPYTGKYQTAKLAYGAQEGTALLQKKDVEQIGLLASNILPSGVRYGKDFTSLSGDGLAMWPLPAAGLGTNVGGATAVQTVLDEDEFPFDQDWSTDSRVCLQIAPNTPATFNALVVSLKTNEG